MSEKAEAVPAEDVVADAPVVAESPAKILEDAEAALKAAMAKVEEAKAKAKAAAEAEYKAIAVAVKTSATKKATHTFKRQGEEIFRRDMGEPEFFLHKKDRFPRPILTAEQQESLTRKAEIPIDNTPKYVPQHVLSPEFGGLSNYERGVDSFLNEAKKDLQILKNDPDATPKQIRDAKDKIIYLRSLHENYFIGMNVFRTAKGGRDRIQ